MQQDFRFAWDKCTGHKPVIQGEAANVSLCQREIFEQRQGKVGWQFGMQHGSPELPEIL